MFSATFKLLTYLADNPYIGRVEVSENSTLRTRTCNRQPRCQKLNFEMRDVSKTSRF